MNAVKNAVNIGVGFIPFVLFSVLAPMIGAGSAAAAGFVGAIAVTAATAKGGIKMMPSAQAVILLVMAILGFTGSPSTDAVLVDYGPVVAAFLLSLFMIVTAAANKPFTAQFARSQVPPSLWRDRRFLNVNRRLSMAWGLAVAVLGLCHVIGAQISTDGPTLFLRLAVNWVLPLAAFWGVNRYSKRTVAGASHRLAERTAA